jgi:hypothetical protein
MVLRSACFSWRKRRSPAVAWWLVIAGRRCVHPQTLPVRGEGSLVEGDRLGLIDPSPECAGVDAEAIAKCCRHVCMGRKA